MQREKVDINLNSFGVYQVARGSSLGELCESIGGQIPDIVVAGIINSAKLRGMHYLFFSDCDVELVMLNSEKGRNIYRISVGFLLNKAVHDLYPGKRLHIKHTISNGVYCEIPQLVIDDEVLTRLTEYVRELNQKNLPIEREYMETQEAIEIFAHQHHVDKMELLHYRMHDMVHLFGLDGFYEYTYWEMVVNTGMIQDFNLLSYEPGFIYQTPENGNTQPSPYVEQRKLGKVYQEAKAWAEMLQTPIIPALNRRIEQNEINDIIAISEALHEKKIAEIADIICAHPEIRVILIAGPSSSGKTTFAQRLMIQLRVNGKKPSSLSLDNYFIDREKTPVDAEGKHDYEALEALQLDLFNQHLQQLIAGQEVKMPLYDFIAGKSVPEKISLQVLPNEPLLIEGIHGLNEQLTWSIAANQKFKIYVSALTQLNLDHSNRIATTDARLIRRIVRDHRTRGHSALDTIARWPSVRRGEDQNIFRFQENADVFFNSSLLYELAVLKPMVEPLLRGSYQNQIEQLEINRLIKVLSFIDSAYDVRIPHNSILREFIGGSWFQV